jgi:hypothetical protein
MIIKTELRRGLLNNNLTNHICNKLCSPGRLQIAAAFMAGMVITAAVTYYWEGTGKLSTGENIENNMPEQQNMPGFYIPVNYPEIVPDEYFKYELVYAFSEGALISG